MYMNLKLNQHKRISFNTTTMTSLGVHRSPLNLASPLLNLIFSQVPLPQLFWVGDGGCYHEFCLAVTDNLFLTYRVRPFYWKISS